MIQSGVRDNISIVNLNNGETNPINRELVDSLSSALKESRENPEVHALVLASASDKFFSIGLDIPSLYGLSRDEFASFYKAYNRLCLDLYTMPKPTVAAVTGHAIAGGCILTLCCDYRIIGEGKKLMGLNEIKLGVPVPYPADRILRDIVGAPNAREITATGEFYKSDESLQLGIVDWVVPSARVVSESVEKAGQLGAMPPEAFSIIKRNRIESVESEILDGLEEKEKLFIDCWFSEGTRPKLKEAMENF
jgi:enoyl-CoA hydratase/carnithine racemase